MEELSFKLELEQIRVTLEDTEGNSVAYLLRELTGKQRDDYQKIVAKQIRPDSDGKPTNLAGIAGLRTQLLIFSMVKEQGLEPVSLKEVDSWPASVHEKLFEKAQAISGLGVSEEDSGNE